MRLFHPASISRPAQTHLSGGFVSSRLPIIFIAIIKGDVSGVRGHKARESANNDMLYCGLTLSFRIYISTKTIEIGCSHLNATDNPFPISIVGRV